MRKINASLKRHWIVLALLFSACVFVYSCKKDEKTEIKGLSILELKSWYQQQIKTRNVSTNMFANYVPNWETSQTSSVDGYNVTEVNFINPNKVVMLHGEKTDADRDKVLDRTHVKLLLFNMPGSNTVEAAFMMLQENTQQNVNNVNYKNFGSFSGMLSYYNFAGKFENGYELNSGKITKSLTKSVLKPEQMLALKEKQNNIGAKPGDKLALYNINDDCTAETYDFYYESCTYIVGMPELGTNCSWIYSYSLTVVNCVPGSEGPGGGPPDGGYVGIGGGGSSTPTSDPYNICDRKVKVNTIASTQQLADKNNYAKTATSATGNEYGYEQKVTAVNGTTYMDIAVRSDNSTNTFNMYFTWNATQGFTIGDVHSHPLGTPPSPQDVFGMVENFNKAELQNAGAADITFYKTNVSITVVTSNGNYVATVKDWGALQSAYNTYLSDKAAYISRYQDFASKSGGPTQALLSLLGNAINLYKSNNGSNNMKPLTVGSDGTVLIVPCPGEVVE
ncbi:hypothetical protein [Pedobacter punctiformis]|uniref:Uncharacterized protein n=1 Tax=Pedobacter punctiformis TaxID=3004097 RepID=A0ABT4LDA9_9SPHI|nr:hypothetical protein [Pedobacter sp. HCMS5-2]MCZ4245717.1 hypothetical protein [Pedobacter sp. HCMS5-2]